MTQFPCRASSQRAFHNRGLRKKEGQELLLYGGRAWRFGSFKRTMENLYAAPESFFKRSNHYVEEDDIKSSSALSE